MIELFVVNAFIFVAILLLVFGLFAWVIAEKNEIKRLKSELAREKRIHKSVSLETGSGPVVISGNN